MNNIPNEIRTKLKRLSPYIGPNICQSVREKALAFWKPPCSPEEFAGWRWELAVCDIDDNSIDPAGYVAIRPLDEGEHLLVFVLDDLQQRAGSNPEDLVVLGRLEQAIPLPSIQAAKAYLDSLLATETP